MTQPRCVITIVTVFPELFENWLKTSLLGRAQESGLVSVNCLRLSDYVAPKQRIDTPMCGPGAGMVLKAPVVAAAIDDAFARYGRGRVIFFTPSGQLLTQRSCQTMAAEYFGEAVMADSTSSSIHLVLVCGRYEGVDCRVIEHYNGIEISIGNYVLMGGDLPAQVFLEGLLRYVPGIVGDAQSVEHDSFTGPFVDFPAYGQPNEWCGKSVPPVLLSGDHARIEQWRTDTALTRTVQEHFSWLRTSALSSALRQAVAKKIPAHYVVLMHDQVLIGRKDPVPGTTSVTTIDVHDIARTSATYGVKKFYVVTPLHDQKELLRVFFEFWHTDQGRNYNENRFDAMRCVQVVNSLAEAEADIAAQHNGQNAIKIATSARPVQGVRSLAFDEQSVAWQSERPIALLFGTGQGMTQELLETCDFVLTPIHGFSAYNHLSVRAAVAIILDRWLGYFEPSR
ncbi:MAG: tRNA (guanine37-N1)-methyltransferase [Candidatus Dependentiae bacterium]|nr:tRNA (guanine37-N1)-methyltransferase [Candidatus Dependentiae bacterium]